MASYSGALQFRIEYKKGDLNHIANMLSHDQGHKFDKQELNDFNNITLLPNLCFHVNKSPATLRDRILDTQTYDLFSQRKLLEIEQASSSLKTGHFTSVEDSIYFRNLLRVPTESLRKELLASCHNHVLSGHPGIAVTMLLIRQ